MRFSFREKLHYVSRKCRQSHILPYRITDTGGLVEKTKVIERKRIKELGNTARRNLWEMPCRSNAAAAKEYIATVYLKHRSLQKRKLRYRG